MGTFQRLVARAKGSPYREGAVAVEVERWVRDILLVAAIKKSRSIVVRKTADGRHLEALIHECGSEACAARMRLIAASHEAQLIAELRQRMGRVSNSERAHRTGTFEETIADKSIRVTIELPKAETPFRVHLSIEHFNTTG